MDIERYQYIFGQNFKNERSLEWIIYQYLYYNNIVGKEDKSFYARLGQESTKARLNSVIDFYHNLMNEINGNSLQDFYSRKYLIENQLAILRNSINEEPLPMIHFGNLLLQRKEVEDLICIKMKHDVLPEIEVYANLNIKQLFEFLS
ncbi:hypothetical protein MM239_12325 [Belliella sp. DSM 111904]|uniref:Uncharacterized protein n=1 Tax=Belliella filtrata TaxID=2923435 RepID=A0ABS9V2G4_9BACT|nr:hypothetical protein [Belliella filtrata]MCH7410185.1 hypothetical protein [Belliella filtrata]